MAEPLAELRYHQGFLLGRMRHLGFDLRSEAALTTVTSDIITSSAIEGESLNPEQVRSFVARHLGLETGGQVAVGGDVEGIVEMMTDATKHYREPLTTGRLFAWQAALFPTGRSGMSKITVGAWRSDERGPMQMLSGSMGREKVHIEAPPAERSEYYRRLEAQQKGDVDITPWLQWFLACLGRSFDRAEESLKHVLYKARVRRVMSRWPAHSRQKKIVERMMDNFEGYMHTSKYARIAKCSPDTALRDINQLVEHGIFIRNPGGGRSTSYRLATGDEL